MNTIQKILVRIKTQVNAIINVYKIKPKGFEFDQLKNCIEEMVGRIGYVIIEKIKKYRNLVSIKSSSIMEEFKKFQSMNLKTKNSYLKHLSKKIYQDYFIRNRIKWYFFLNRTEFIQGMIREMVWVEPYRFVNKYNNIIFWITTMIILFDVRWWTTHYPGIKLFLIIIVIYSVLTRILLTLRVMLLLAEIFEWPSKRFKAYRRDGILIRMNIRDIHWARLLVCFNVCWNLLPFCLLILAYFTFRNDAIVLVDFKLFDQIVAFIKWITGFF
jgi:hypothetical protein